MLVLQITDAQGSVVATTFSDGDPKKDVGAKDPSGLELPTKDNESSIDV